MYDVAFHPPARDEYFATLAWYARVGEDVARAFEREVERGLLLITDAPNRWPRLGRRHRRDRRPPR